MYEYILCKPTFRGKVWPLLQSKKIRQRGTSLRMCPPAHAGSSIADFSTLKTDAIRSSETSVHTRYTRCQIPEDGNLHSHRCENLKSYITKEQNQRFMQLI
jgi:hypothetical protein